MQITHRHNEINLSGRDNPTGIADVVGLVVTALLVISAITALLPDAVGHLSVYFASAI